ncbi:MAG TPA: alpha-galactosidase, partial [Chryseolinea sp.]
PMPVVLTKLSCRNHDFHLKFESYSPDHREGRLPRVFIDLGLDDSKAILDRHCAHARDLGLLDENKKHYDWWHNPIYCTWGDQCYLQNTAPEKLADSIALPMDEAKVMHWADQIRSIYSGEVNYIIDAGWFDHLGDYDPTLRGFESVENFQGVIARLKAKGFRVILWYTPFWVQRESKVEKEHPEFLVHHRDGSTYRDQDQRAFLDYSHPGVREYAKKRVEYLLGTLGGDGFKIDMNYVHPLMSDIIFHDPSWGYGNQFWLEVMKFYHGCATAVKDDAFFTISGIESYLQPYASSVRLNDLFDFYNAKAWYDRAELVTRLMPDVPIDVDGWPSSIEKMREY